MSGEGSKVQGKAGGSAIKKINDMTKGGQTGQEGGSIQHGGMPGHDGYTAHWAATTHDRGAEAKITEEHAVFGDSEKDGWYGFAERGMASGGAGCGGAQLDGGAERTWVGYKDGDTHVKGVNFKAGGKLGAGAGGVAAKADIALDAVKVESKHVDANIGLNLTTGVDFGPDGGSVSAAGFGIGASSSGINFSTPIGGIGFKW